MYLVTSSRWDNIAITGVFNALTFSNNRTVKGLFIYVITGQDKARPLFLQMNVFGSLLKTMRV